MPITRYLRRLMEERAPLSRVEARKLMEAILCGETAEIEIAAALGALAGRGETAEEIAGFVDAMRAAATGLPLTDGERSGLVDACGTGGDGSGTFNISTGAALVAAAAGVRVAKHGNRAVTSRCGSADVLEALGIPVDLPPDRAAEMLRRHGFVFLLASAHHPAMRAVMPARKTLGVRTVFNLLGPLTNPAGARRQVLGVYGARQVGLVAEAMALLGTEHAMVVHGLTEDGTGMDELSISGTSTLAEVRAGVVTRRSVQPDDAGLARADARALRGGDAEANAAILRAIFAGERGARRDVLVLNAAAVLVVAGLTANLQEGVVLAAETIDQGKVARLVVKLAT